ncbi:MAG: transposase [Thaumarchaeota archaeon]|nr:transposase [Nitrososphaerota archaeon]
MNEYKSVDCNGFPVIFVRPNGTSSKCAICGLKLVPEEHRMMRCPTCQSTIDRDVNASKNILARGLEMLERTGLARFEPDAVQGEAMKQFKDARADCTESTWVMSHQVDRTYCEDPLFKIATLRSFCILT